jgi:ABC-type antimicrobial peptide transport system permease subunit
VSINVTRLEDYLEFWRVPSRIVAALSGALGALALLLCSIGVYGMVSYSVSRSVRDIGIRMALGADGAKVMHHVLWEAMRPVLIDGTVGVALCAAVSGVLSSMMFGRALTFVRCPRLRIQSSVRYLGASALNFSRNSNICTSSYA